MGQEYYHIMEYEKSLMLVTVTPSALLACFMHAQYVKLY